MKYTDIDSVLNFFLAALENVHVSVYTKCDFLLNIKLKYDHWEKNGKTKDYKGKEV